jgi:hypothetical protein
MTIYTYNSAYQSSIATTVTNAMQAHNRVTAIRVDLRMPDDFDGSVLNTCIMTRFIESLKAKVESDLKRKQQAWQRNLACDLKYAWVREVGPINGKKHFHVLLLVNKDIYHSLGDFNEESGNLSAMIRQAWCSALGLPFLKYQKLVHFPRGGVVYMDKNHHEFMQQQQLVLDKANYLAKEATKHYGDGQRSFGCSR